MSKRKSVCKPATDISPHLSSLIEPYSVGSGITKRIQYRQLVEKFGNDTRPPDVEKEEEWLKICLDAWNALTLDQHIYENLENRVRRILVAAGLPAPETSNVIFSIPDGKQLDSDAKKVHHGRTGGLVSLVEAQGYRERIAIEWYAARILVLLLAHKACKEKGLLYVADIILFEIGMLTGEKKIREIVTENAKKATPRKRIPSVLRFVQTRLRKNISLTAAALWRQIPCDDSELQIGKAKLYINRGRLIVIENHGKGWMESGSLSFPAFRKYVTVVRKSLDR